jgi:hypothetical protein
VSLLALFFSCSNQSPPELDFFCSAHIKFTDKDFQASSLDKGSLTKSSLDNEGSTIASDAASDCNIVGKGLKKGDKAKVKGGNSKGKALPTKKKKRADVSTSSKEDDKEFDNEKKANKAKVKQPIAMSMKSKMGSNTDDGMEVDLEPVPKPTPKVVTNTPKGDEDEPARIKQKKIGER